MTKPRLKPWHEVVRLKEELRTGELSLAQFAADLHEVTLGRGSHPVYENPERFFGLTYATHALRDLVRDVAGRLAGQSDKAVRQLELTYGGGKTHTLITLYHLFRDPTALPELPAVSEFREHVGYDLPAAYPATLCFDKIDVETGIKSVRGPAGETRDLLHPWSVLAYQLVGDDGLRAIHADGQAQERETPPAEPLLAELLAKPQERGMSTLILVDEVLMYARSKAGKDAVWGDRIVDFFQHLTQAVVKVNRAAMVVSLLATDPRKQADETGKALMHSLFDVVRRQKEEGVEPVQKKDVAEVLRRRFFEAEDIREPETYRSHVIGVVRNLAKVQPTTDRSRPEDEEHFLRNFPFHPKLTDVFYTCWTQLEGFQRTRGILRTLATALREAEKWDTSPLVGPAALLTAPGDTGVSEAIGELAGIATTEPVDGKKTEWKPLLAKELEKARDIQHELPALAPGREAEQAVVAVFLHSQPVGRKIQTQPLCRMIGAGAPNKIEVDKGLERWRDVSWFLDDEDAGPGERRGPGLPKDWRLGNRPNLRQMHDDACRNRVTEQAVDHYLEAAARKTKSLTEGASAAGVQVHMMPASPQDVADDLKFRYVVLGIAGASESGKPSKLATSFLATKGEDRPRVHRNALVVAAPSRDGLKAVRGEIRALLGWEEVEVQLAGHGVEAAQKLRLRRRLEEARRRVPGTLRAAWCIVTTFGRDGEVHAFKLASVDKSLFIEIKKDKRSRIQETVINAEALAPGGPYDLWREDEESRFVADLASAFARRPRLPKALNSQLLFGTVFQGVKDGLFVACLKRPDGSRRTWWRESVEEASSADPQLQVALPKNAELDHLLPTLLAPGTLPELWPEGDAGDGADQSGGACLTLARLAEYFAGGYEVPVLVGELTESAIIPKCSEQVLHDAVREAVKEGAVWLISGPASVWLEDVPHGAIGEGAKLLPRPTPVAAGDLTEENLPSAWSDGRTNGAELTQALGVKRGRALPWPLMARGIKESVDSRWLSLLPNSVSVEDCPWAQAGALLLERPSLPKYSSDGPDGPDDPPDGTRQPPLGREFMVVTLDAEQVQELGERIPELLEAAPTAQLRFQVGVKAEGGLDAAERTAVNQALERVTKGLKVD